ncbi:MAG: helix-turn-helix transcriptional regulator [Arcobacter sp.]|uniref:XRE family transcriptional regulator n=1 Tax=Arcobacter sp. TaxID=1872629 RepID=UPI003C769693
MNKQELTQILKDINLSKKEFANLSNISYNTINNWNDDNRPVPPWVDSWLENYVKAKSYSDVKDKVFQIEGIK